MPAQKLLIFLISTTYCLQAAHPRIAALAQQINQLTQKASGYIGILERNPEIALRSRRAATHALQHHYSRDVTIAALLLEMGKNFTPEERHAIRKREHASRLDPMSVSYGTIPDAAFPILTAEYLHNQLRLEVLSLIKLQPITGYWYNALPPEDLQKFATTMQNPGEYNLYLHDRHAWYKFTEARRAVQTKKIDELKPFYNNPTVHDIIHMAECTSTRVVEDAPAEPFSTFMNDMVEVMYRDAATPAKES